MLPAIPAVAARAIPHPRLRLALANAGRLEANDQFNWDLSLRLVNGLDVGIYSDSVTCVFEDLDPGETRAPRRRPLTVGALARILGSISAGDSASVEFAGVEQAEHSRLTFRAHVHTAAGRSYFASTTAEIAPGSTSRLYPSSSLESGGHRIEYVFIPAMRGTPPAPGLLLVHGHGSHARLLLPQAWELAGKGYAVMLVSQPGYGKSEGPADLMGPATVHAVGAALDRLKRTPGVDSTRLGVWGFSRGATAAALLAQQRDDIAAIVAQSGIYDLWATWRDTKVPGFRETIVREAGRDSAAWRARSPAAGTHPPQAAFLMLHGEKDVNAPFPQAQAYSWSLRRSTVCETSFIEDAEHLIPWPQASKVACEFLGRRLKL